jgi:HD superfamily phosphodiesterase
LEEKIVWDADKIDLLGAVGIARGFHWNGTKPFAATVKLAFKVYTPIYDMLNTTSARKLAKKRYEETMSFLSALEKELSLEDLDMG